MGFLWGTNASAFDSDVEKITNEEKTSEDWAAIMNFCDKIGDSEQSAKESLRAIIKRLNHEDPHVQLLAITLLDACVNNCGKSFRLVVASREFTQEYRKLLQQKNLELKVNEKLKMVLKKWAEEEFKNDDQLSLIPSLYKELLKEGISFPKAEVDRPKGASKEEIEEFNDLNKAIELSLLDSTSPQKSTASNSNSLYPSTKLQPTTTQEYRKVRALYDFEAAEDNELTFKAGEIIFVMDDSDQNWWKGYNQNGEGLFPANFVSSDLKTEPEPKPESSKAKVTFDENVKVVKLPAAIEINETKIDRLLHLLHEADPCDDKSDTDEMLNLEEEVNAMGPLIDAELEKVDRKHAQLTQLSTELVEALNLYHMLMRDSMFPSKPVEGHMPSSYFNGVMPQMPPGSQFMSLQHPSHPHPHPHQHPHPQHPHPHPQQSHPLPHPHPHPHQQPHMHQHPGPHPPPPQQLPQQHPHPHTHSLPHQHPQTHPHPHQHPPFPPIPNPPSQGPQSLPPQHYNTSFPPQSMPNYVGGYQPPHMNYGHSQHLPPQQPMSPNSSMPPQMSPSVSAPYPTQINQPVSKLKSDFNQQ